MRMASRIVLLAVGLGACGDDNGGSIDAPIAVDARVAVDAPSLEDLPIDETRALTGLSANVEVVRDKRGMPHIYARELGDALRVQGYLMARDRFGQMEFLRRLALGRLSELAPLQNLVESDRYSRFIGYERLGKAIYASLAPTDPSRTAANAFVAGVNAYIDEVVAAPVKTPYIPPGAEAVFDILLSSPHFGRWQPADIFALARFQTTDLSYNSEREITRTRALAGARANLDAAHNGVFYDLFTEIQGRRVYTRPGFPTQQKPVAARRPVRTSVPSLATLDGALDWLRKTVPALPRTGGSNNWVVHGSKTASHAPLLANDPHLPLISPPIWWYVHLNTKKLAGASGVNVAGVAFAALPGVVLGFNEDLAWGATVSYFDVTDVYDETVTGGASPTVLFKGKEVAIEKIVEVIRKSGQPDELYEVEVVPHHGPIIPGSRVGGKALSVKYTGHTPSNELAYFLGLASAKNVDEAWTAQRNFRVGGQNFVTISRGGDIAWNTDVWVPVRDPRAVDLTIDPDGTVRGQCPTMVLPGTGDYEWIGELPLELIPKDRNPARGFIATANQDSVGVTDDGNPCNEPNHYYLGGFYAEGYREGRIVERLTALTTAGGVTKDDMIRLQAEGRSGLGDTLRDPLVAILERVTAPGSTLFSDPEKAQLADVKTRLAAWSRETPHGVGETDAVKIADSVATTIFNVGLTRIIPLAFGDEAAAIGVRPDRGMVVLERALTMPQMMATYDGGQDSILWDDIRTGPTESKDQIIGRGFLEAMAYLRTRLGDDVSTWRWGRLHTVRFESALPFSDPLSIPPPGDPVYPDGFPRNGDFGSVDASNFGDMWATTDFTHSSGPSQRLVVEMLPDGPRAYNALPGGQSMFTTSPHHDDEAQHWIKNEQPAVSFTESDVVRNAEARLRFTP